MSISIKKYVDITSGVAAGASVKERELIMRLFTNNVLVPAGTIVEMTELSDVGTFFGTDSEEYKRASPYFGFVSKLITKASKISFAHYDSATPSAPPLIVGGTPSSLAIADYNAITNGGVSFQIGSTTYKLGDLDLSGAASLNDVANDLQTALQADIAGATVVYDNVGQRFNVTFTGITAPANVLINAPDTGTDIRALLGWTSAAGMTTSAGSAATTVLDQIIEADEASDNYGSFATVQALDLDTTETISAWNLAQNVKYQYLVGVTLANWQEWYNRLASYGGTALTIVADTNTEYDEQIPGIILGATNYNLRNASQNYMFQQISGISAKVDDNTLATLIDTNSRVNYMGQTKNAGQGIVFYQDGYLCGDSTSPLQMNVYANEQWFKAAATAQLMEALLNVPIIPATDEGRAIVLGYLQDVVDRAKYNGTIKAEKALNVNQKAYILQVTDDPLAWQQIESIGYWLDAVVQEEAQANGTTKYIVDYTFLYSKADAVNKITGRDILI